MDGLLWAGGGFWRCRGGIQKKEGVCKAGRRNYSGGQTEESGRHHGIHCRPGNDMVVYTEKRGTVRSGLGSCLTGIRGQIRKNHLHGKAPIQDRAQPRAGYCSLDQHEITGSARMSLSSRSMVTVSGAHVIIGQREHRRGARCLGEVCLKARQL